MTNVPERAAADRTAQYFCFSAMHDTKALEHEMISSLGSKSTQPHNRLAFQLDAIQAACAEGIQRVCNRTFNILVA